MSDRSTTSRAKLAKVQDLIASGKFVDAKKLLKKLNKSDKSSPIVWHLLGSANLGLELYSDAEQCARQALKLQPDFAEAYFNLGLVFDLQGNPQEAINNYQQAVLLDPGDTDTRLNLAALYREQGNNTAAIEHYQEIIKHNPGITGAYIGIADINFTLGQLEPAKLVLEEAERMFPHNADILYAQGLIAEGAIKFDTDIPAQLDSAYKYYNDALSIDPGSHPAIYGIARVLEKRGDFAQLIDEKRHYDQPVNLNMTCSPGKAVPDPTTICIVFFQSGKDHKLAEKMILSVRAAMPDARIVQLSDPATQPVKGIDELFHADIDVGNMMFSRHWMYAAYIEQTRCDVVFIDTDIVIQKDLKTVFGQWDIGLTWRQEEKDDILTTTMPFNGGILFSRPTQGSRHFWRATLAIYERMPGLLKKWYGDQLCMSIYLRKEYTSRDSEELVKDHIKIRLLPCDIYNYTPGQQNEDLQEKYIVHYKGNKKGWMMKRKISTPGNLI